MKKKTTPMSKKANWTIFFIHVLLFVFGHLLFVSLFGLIPLSELDSRSYIHFLMENENFINHGVNIYQNNTVNGLSGVWKSVLIIHLIIIVIDTLFLKKNESENHSADTKLPRKKIKKIPPYLNGLQRLKNPWIYLILAGLLEIVWATALKMDMLAGPFILALIISFDLLIRAVKQLGIGTAYTVFTGIGTVGIIFVDFFMFNESMNFVKVLLILLLIVFIIGLKVTAVPQKMEGEK